MRRIVAAVLRTVVVPPRSSSETPQVIAADHVRASTDNLKAPTFPFILYNLGESDVTPSGAVRPTLQVYVYDEPGSYLRIDAMLADVRLKFRAYPFSHPSGEYLGVVDHLSDSADLPAEDFAGITRFASFQLVGRPA